MIRARRGGQDATRPYARLLGGHAALRRALDAAPDARLRLRRLASALVGHRARGPGAAVRLRSIARRGQTRPSRGPRRVRGRRLERLRARRASGARAPRSARTSRQRRACSTRGEECRHDREAPLVTSVTTTAAWFFSSSPPTGRVAPELWPTVSPRAWPCSPPWDSLSRSASTRRPSSRTSCSKQAVSERSVKASKPKANQTEPNRIASNRIEPNQAMRGVKDEESWGVRVRVWCVVG